ncbi:MAG: glycerol-3-phosphate acyltransferase [Chloroflexi bacterium]|nr:glycerol-3-phosphate acyltransferase [Chloroflexota bacterium]MBM3175236.1 glycerol-3-phosphate acyltransferase [Chloroflexota bacterium]
MEIIKVVLSLALAYLLGAIPSAYIFGRIKGIDIRDVGDRNVGAFNAFRHLGLGWGLATLAADISKGALAILAAKVLGAGELVVFVAGIAAVIGHNWTVFLRFRGGRGLAVVIGVLLALLPREMLIAAAVGITALVITRSSVWLGVALFAPLVLLGWLFNEPLALLVYSVVLPCLSGITHWLTMRNLPPEAQREALLFWVADKGSHKGKGTDQTR